VLCCVVLCCVVLCCVVLCCVVLCCAVLCCASTSGYLVLVLRTSSGSAEERKTAGAGVGLSSVVYRTGRPLRSRLPHIRSLT
jgi:hypothetical protein